MSMGLLTLFQFLYTLFAYILVTIALPCAVLKRKMSHYRLLERILFYYISGNFYAINLVYLLQLLHISNFFTILLGLTVAPAGIWCRLNNIPVKDALYSLWDSIKKVITGALRVKALVVRLLQMIRKGLASMCKKFWSSYSRNMLDWWLTIAFILMVLWVYGIRAIRSFGYGASDIPVHLYWVNELSNNHVFAGGVYPFGMHNVIYLIHTIFRIDAYVLFRVFALVQCVSIHLIALLFLRLCCKSKYAAYSGMIVYTISSYFNSNNVSRFISSLPQEYSMIFILPTAYYAIRFFEQKRKEIKDESEAKSSKLCLVGLVISFSLALTSHFYGAIIAGLFCIGMAAGYAGWLVRPAFLKRIMAAAMVSLVITLLPMGIAYATGTRLEGSLYWGRSIIANSIQNQEEEDSVEETDSIEETDPSGLPSDSTVDPAEQENADLVDNADAPSEEKVSFVQVTWDKIKQKILSIWNAVGYRINVQVLTSVPDWYSTAVRWMIVFMIAVGILLFLSPDRTYGAMLVSTGITMVILSLLLVAESIGIPVLMDAARTAIFFSYMLALVIAFTIDVCVYIVALFGKKRWIMDLLSFAVIFVIGIFIWQQDRVREPMKGDGLETNEAITCLSNIIALEKDYSWTIFSANDETNMVYGHGYHYELITFLREIETIGGNPVTAPTEVLYFFVEKIPLAYSVYYEESGQMVSKKGAQQAVPQGNGLGVYQGRNRWIVMSHMYYWAQELQRLYPNEMKIYMETDQFICYRLEQNPFSVIDLAIDYGYNTAK